MSTEPGTETGTGRDADGHGYRVTDSRLIHHGALFDVRADTVEMPGGDTAARELCVHPGAVAVVALDDEGRVALIRQYRHALGERLWELPAGLRDVDGEEPRATAERELQEETGLAAGHYRPLVTLYPSPGFSTEVVHVYLATDITAGPRPEREHEESEIELRRVPLDEAVSWVLGGRIRNGIAVAGLLAARAESGSGDPTRG